MRTTHKRSSSIYILNIQFNYINRRISVIKFSFFVINKIEKTAVFHYKENIFSKYHKKWNNIGLFLTA